MSNTLNSAGFVIPESQGETIPEQTVEEQPAQLSTGVGMMLNAYAGFMVTFPQTVGLAVENQNSNLFDPGPHLSQEEWKDSNFFRKGMSVPASGINQNVANVNANRFDADTTQKDLLSTTSSSDLSRIGIATTGLIGSLLNPINLAAGGAASEATVGVLGVKLLKNIGDKEITGAIGSTVASIAKASVKAGTGVVEGVGFTAPSAAAQLAKEDQLGEPIDALGALETVAAGGIVGGVIRGIGLIKQPVSELASRLIHRNAIDQAMDSKRVESDGLMENGFNSERDAEELGNIDIAENAKTGLDNIVENQTNKISDTKTELKNHIETNNLKDDVKNAPDSGPELIAKYSKLWNGNRFKWNSNDVNFMSSGLPDTDVMNWLQNIVQTEPVDRAQDDQEFLKEFMENPSLEKKLTNEEVIRRTNTQKDLLEELNEPNISDDEGRVIGRDNDENNTQLKSVRARLRDLKKREELDPKASELKDSIAQQEQSLEDTKVVKETQDVLLKMNKENTLPVDGAVIKSNSEKLLTPESNATHNPEEAQAYQDELDSIPDEPPTDASEEERVIKALQKDNALDKESKGKIEDIKDRDIKMGKFEKSIRGYFKCLLGE